MRHGIFFSLSIGFLCFFPIAPSQAQWISIPSPNGTAYPVHSFAVIGSNLFTAVGFGVVLTTDNGASFTNVNNGLTDTTVYAFGVSGTNLFAGTYGGVFLTTDLGTNWTRTNKALGDSDIVTALLANGTNTYASIVSLGVSSGLNGVFLSKDKGTSWTPVNTGLTGTGGVVSLAAIGSNLFAGTYGGGVFLSTNNGTSWTAVNNGLTNSRVYVLTVIGSNLFAGTSGGGVFLTANNGTSWTAVNNGLPENNDTVADITAFAASGSNLFVGAARAGVYLSTDNGTSWIGENSGFTNNPYIQALVVSGADLIAGTQGSGGWVRPLSGMLNPGQASDTQSVPFNTTGTVTETLSGDSSKARPHRIDFVNSSGGTLTILSAALTTSGNRFSISQFLHSIPDTVPAGGTFSMIVNFFGNDSGTVFLDTLVLSIDPNLEVTSYSVYLKGNSFSGKSSVSQNSPSALTGIQSYPNPFTQSTQITFTSPTSGYAEVTIVNMLGVEVARVFSGEVGAGEHNFTWDAGKNAYATQGVYECLVRMNGQVETLPVVLMR